MSVVPGKIVQQVQFCEAHAPVWAAANTTVGLSVPQCTLFTTLTTAARMVYNECADRQERVARGGDQPECGYQRHRRRERPHPLHQDLRGEHEQPDGVSFI